MPRDFYQLLGVSKTASADELKKAYRKLAMQYHPDKNQGDKKAEEKFKEISHAYDILSDEQKRAAYDRFGHAAFEGGQGGGAGAGAAGFDFGSGFADIFEDLFGGFGGGGARRGQQSGPSRGADLRYDLTISLEDAYSGTQQKIKVTTAASCEVCHGSGAAAGSKPVTCPTCNGSGRVRASQGFFTIERTCGTCHGAGKIIRDPCKNCAGSGRVRREKTLNVSIPAGVEEGTRIRLAGEGEAGPRGGPPGDLYVFLSIRAHKLFERDGADLHCNVPIAMTTAALGGSIEVPTIGGGRVKVTFPEGTQNGDTLRVRGKGMPVMRSTSHGDMYIHTHVETPVRLTKEQKDLLKKFDATSGKGHSPQAEGFFSKIKEFWDDLKE